MLRAHKIKLNPTPEQEVYFRKACGIARFTYNWALDTWCKNRNKPKDDRKSVTESKNDFNEIKGKKFPWIYEVTKCAPEYAFMDLNKAMSNHFKNPKKFKFPKYKTKKRSKMAFGVDNDNFAIHFHRLHLAKMNEPVNMAEELRLYGKLMSCRISYKAGHWYASITVDDCKPKTPKKLGDGVPSKEKSIGIDLGIKTLAVLSDGRTFENQKHIGHALKKVRRLNRKLSRSQIGSNNHEKVVLELAKAYEKVTNLRNDQYHKAVNAILSTHTDLIGLENLNVKGMMKNKKLSRQFADVAFTTFKHILTYKAEYLGIAVVDVGRFYPSSQLCNDCKYQYKELTLADREWDCPNCGKHHDRDGNASKNIKDEAMRLYVKGIVDAEEKQQKTVTAVVAPDVKRLSDRV